MSITALGYIGIRSAHLSGWDDLATRLLGMQRVDRAGKVRAFRMDDRAQRLLVSSNGASEGLDVLGWEVADAEALDRLAARLDAAGVRVVRAPQSLASERRVKDLILFEDPAGTRLEAFYDAERLEELFIPGRPISGFRTGPLGMGHAVLHVKDVAPLLPFYRDLLGFQVTDYGLTPYPLWFFHVNGRHHSFAMVGSGQSGLHHFMVELGCLDDVGQGYDLAGLEEGRLAYTLGRHSNDHMTSFYANTPSKFFIEYGWGAREIDPQTWQPHETFDGPSYWGHERLTVSRETRERLRKMRLDAAARGMRAPDPGCAWLEAQLRRGS